MYFPLFVGVLVCLCLCVHSSFAIKEEEKAGCFAIIIDKIKHIGGTITEDLRWNTHASNICTKANRIFGFHKRNIYMYIIRIGSVPRITD